MIGRINHCAFCGYNLHKDNEDGYPCCKAYPDGIPYEIFALSREKKENCNNSDFGFIFEEDVIKGNEN